MQISKCETKNSFASEARKVDVVVYSIRWDRGHGLTRGGLSTLVRPQEYLPSQFIRNCLKIEQNCRLFLDIFSSAIMNDLLMTFTFRLKVDAKCIY